MSDADRREAERTGPADREDDFLAVVGMAGRFPGAGDLEEFWANLAAGVDSVTRGAPRLLPGGAADGGDLAFTPSRGTLDGAEWFDAGYFGYSAKEALLIDPQHRVFLECAVTALEDAGLDPDRVAGAVGVYGGATETGYAQALRAHAGRLPGVSEDDVLLGTAPDFLVARTAERLGLRGPAVAVQAACATALVAVHTAGRALLAGDCDVALAGGVAVHVPPKHLPWNGPDGTLAPDGVCRAFDARAAGTVASNGVGVVVLRRLGDALAAGDPIRAVLRGSAVTNDGADRVGFTAPTVSGQAAAVREAQLAAGVDARSVTCVEAHGTATPLGDPIEVAALTRAFREETDESGFCALGSVKTNIGHADAAAGAAGLLKTVLALGHRQIPPSLHFEEPNPQIDFASSPFRVATALEDWKPYGETLRAGVSSFAVGGVNAHLVLEEAPRRAAAPSERRARLLVHSARTASALQARLDRFAQAAPLESADPADVAWTLQTGRRAHAHRAFGVATGSADSVGDVERAVAPTRVRPTVFLFPGRVGPAEAWRLHATEPAFRTAFDTVLGLVDDRLAASVRSVARGLDWPERAEVRDTYVFAFEYALAALWQRWGIAPSAVFGTGTGAAVAAAVAGSLTPADALRLIGSVPGAPQGPPRPHQVDVLFADGTRHEAGGTLDTARWAAERAAGDPADAASAALLADTGPILLQVGAGALPAALAGQLPSHSADRLLLPSLPELTDGGDALAAMYRTLGRLWLAGAPVDWAGVHDGERRIRVPLPTYPFERLPYLVRHPDQETEAAGAAPAVSSAVPPTAPEEEIPGAAAVAAEPDASRPDDGTPLSFVLGLFGEALGLPDIEPDESFFELGGDSLVGIKLLARIREAYPVEIKMSSLFTAATAADLAAVVEEQLAAAAEGEAS
ncbi:beta-ketoacyl synthase N-terminal-like domain-containing protein [Streptomyces rubiginosohelvolus]|uniref:beta-ketoacyl synthase N-terminal-like domain-containing protein n=1 Tax=Streptomyces rubiginosohelvolus TaxID=67362 RepID=UPI0037BAB757